MTAVNESIRFSTWSRAGLAAVLLATNAVAQTNPPQPATSAPATTNAPVAAPVISAEALQKLLERIDQLEKRGTEQTEQVKAVQQQSADNEKKLLNRIQELEGKVTSLESGKVLPEIALPPGPELTVNDLDQKIRILQRNNELAAEAAEAKAKDQPKLSIGQNGVSFSSSDTNFVLKLRGLVQLDSRTFFESNDYLDNNDSFLLRRARPIIEGTVFRDFDYTIVPEFGGSGNASVVDAYLRYTYSPELKLRAGKFKSPVGLEQLQSDSYLPFNERSLVSNLIPNRNVGVQLEGGFADGLVEYAVGIFNGAGDARNANNVDFNDNKEVAGRVLVSPFKSSSYTSLHGLSLGIGASYSQVSSNAAGLPNTTGGSLPGYATDGQQQFFAYNPVIGTVVADGPLWRLSPQVQYYVGPFGFIGEYAVSHHEVLNSSSLRRAELNHTAWQVTGSWILTGEDASPNGITPKNPFDPLLGRWGAWQLVARYGQLDIDEDAFQGFSNPATSAYGATGWSVGINWWLNKNVRVLTSFSHTTFDGGGQINLLDPTTLTGPGPVTQQDESALFTRLQLAF